MAKPITSEEAEKFHNVKRKIIGVLDLSPKRHPEESQRVYKERLKYNKQHLKLYKKH